MPSKGQAETAEQIRERIDRAVESKELELFGETTREIGILGVVFVPLDYLLKGAVGETPLWVSGIFIFCTVLIFLGTAIHSHAHRLMLESEERWIS